MSIAVQRKPVELQAWQLTDVAAMAATLDELTGLGYRGGILNDGGSVWQLEINIAGDTPPVTGRIGDWLVLDFELRKFGDADYAANYEAVA